MRFSLRSVPNTKVVKVKVGYIYFVTCTFDMFESNGCTVIDRVYLINIFSNANLDHLE